MSDQQDKLNQLNNFSDEYDVNPELAKNAISAIKEKEIIRKKEKKTALKWFGMVACCIVIIGLSIFLPVFNSQVPTVIYYAPDKLEFNTVDDLVAFREENSLNYHCFNDNVSVSQVVSVNGSNEIAYLTQETYQIGDYGIDTISLYIVVMPNVHFDFYRDFEDAESTLLVGSTEVDYTIRYLDDFNQYIMKFSDGSINYYMTIITYDDTTQIITKYVAQLLY